MADTFTTAKRSRIMAAVKSCGTRAERTFAESLDEHGVRARANVDNLPGKPDFVIDGANVAVFIHGCFWHGHGCRRGSRVPKTNRDYWLRKVSRNVRRDRRNARQLRAQGYAVFTIWECRLKPHWIPPRLMRAIREREEKP